ARGQAIPSWRTGLQGLTGNPALSRATTAMSHRRGQDHHDATLPWLSRGYRTTGSARRRKHSTQEALDAGSTRRGKHDCCETPGAQGAERREQSIVELSDGARGPVHPRV